MSSDFSQGLRNYENSLISRQAELEDEYNKDCISREEYEDDLANEYWRDWYAEQNIRQAESYI